LQLEDNYIVISPPNTVYVTTVPCQILIIHDLFMITSSASIVYKLQTEISTFYMVV